jgi:hypothetical protein
MKDSARREDARLRAEAYAPAPTDSRLLYGAIAVVLLLLGLIAFGEFYAIDVWRQPLIIVVLAAMAAVAGLMFRMRRARRHRHAHRNEYELGQPSAASVNAASTQSVTLKSVTFTRPFMLPGLDAPHQPGTFELRETREPFDVMHDAYRTISRIVLVDGGKTEVIEVAMGELEYALALDEAPMRGT